MKDLFKLKRISLIAFSLLFLLIIGLILFSVGDWDSIEYLQSDTLVTPPKFSEESGFYQNDFYLRLSVPKNTTVYYTVDSSDPDKNSIKYSEPILLSNASYKKNTYSMRTDVSTGFLSDLIKANETYYPDPEYKSPDYLIDKCNVIRAIAISNNGEKSEIITKCYFVGINPADYKGANIVSITTDPDNLFNSKTGIYVTGEKFKSFFESNKIQPHSCWEFWDANYRQKGKDWERDASVCFFDCNGNMILNQSNSAIRTQGGISRGALPRSLNIYAKNNNGTDSTFQFSLFENTYRPNVVTLAAGGNQLITKFNDYMIGQLCCDLNYATMKYSPYVLFLDGEYWGFYWLAEKYDTSYISHYYNVEENNILMIKNKEVESSDKTLLRMYQSMTTELSNLDMSNSINYEYACSVIDINSYIDYYATMAYIARQEDWPHQNYALWRTITIEDNNYSDGKWRWMIFDCNSSSMDKAFVNDDSLSFIIEKDPVFASLWKNKDFQERFKERLFYIGENCFGFEQMNKFIEDYSNKNLPLLEKNWARFHGINNNKLEEYNNKMESYRIFFTHRLAVVKQWFY